MLETTHMLFITDNYCSVDWTSEVKYSIDEEIKKDKIYGPVIWRKITLPWNQISSCENVLHLSKWLHISFMSSHLQYKIMFFYLKKNCLIGGKKMYYPVNCISVILIRNKISGGKNVYLNKYLKKLFLVASHAL